MVFLTFILVVQTSFTPLYALANDNNSEEDNSLKVNAFITIDHEDISEIPLYREVLEDKDEKDDILFFLENNDEVEVVEKSETHSLVKFDSSTSNLDLNKLIDSPDVDRDVIDMVRKEELDINDSSDKLEKDEIYDNESNAESQEDRNSDNDLDANFLEGYVENKYIELIDDSSDKKKNEDNETNQDDDINEDDTLVDTDIDSEDTQTEEIDDLNSNDSSKEKTSTSTLSLKQEIFYGVALKSETNVYSKQSTDSNILKSYSKGSILKYRSLNSNWYEATVFINGKPSTGYINKSHVESKVDKQETLQGIGTKSPTHIYSKAATNSSKLKSYEQGSILKYKTFSKDWYEARVKVNGAYKTGYIHKSHVENKLNKQETVRGIGTKSPTNIYSKASTSSKKIKSYEQGSILKYKTFSKDWYEARVKVNGAYKTGYIHKSHVENKLSKQETTRGIGTKSPTNVYSKASTNSKKLKSYEQGSILKYKTFSKDWYEATVFIKGNKKTGYIHKSHVENKVAKQESEFGVGLQNKINIYTKSSTDSKVLKSYNKGSILKYKTFSSNWYEARVKVNGTYKTGYIHKNHVGTPSNQIDLRGIGLKKPTNIYQKPFSSSQVIKTYEQGSILKYKEYGNGWYQASVKINGSYQTGYIQYKDIEDAESAKAQKTVNGSFAAKDPTTIYQTASRNSEVIKTYSKGSPIKFKTFSKNWYEARVKVNGSYKTGYIHVDDVGKKTLQYKSTNYNMTINQVVNAQMNNPTKPKTSHTNMYVKKSALKKEKGQWKVNGKNQKVYNSPNGKNKQIGTIDERYVHDTITVYEQSSTSDYYKFHTWIIPLEDEVKKSMNPANFNKGTNAYYQFAVLSEPVYTNDKEVNNKILNNKGILSGKAKAFQEAAKKFNINELYLISHALLETGNGSSALANGDTYKGMKVYNMYGIGAADSCEDPRECGMKRAFEEGWFTPEDAIIGGAEFVAKNYIHAGQDTLYKMKWDPTSIVNGDKYFHQYATDINWAVKQTSNLVKFYDLLDNYSLTFDVPKYK